MSSQSRTPEPDAPVSPSLFRRACGQFATGVTVVTVLDNHGRPHGMTLNSFTSVSLDPPLVLVSIDLRNATLGHFLASSHFGINVLEERQEFLSRRFSSPSANRFEGVEWTHGETGVPMLAGAIANLECAVTRGFEAGDHSVLIGHVVSARCAAGKPLVFYGSGYRTLGT